jgi:NADPH:quinone reductase-like Zn-dependent oxidoreductase
MRAITQRHYGSADVLRLEQVNRPTIADDEVLVRVHAAGLDRGTWHLMAGEPYAIRLIGPRRPKHPVPGLDIAGTVVSTGAAVTRFMVGDEVFGISRGAFAELAAAREYKLVRKPTRLSFEQAAVVAVSGLAALQATHVGCVKAGQHVLIVGASGGVGTFAVQIARALGAEVTGVASTPKADIVRSIGADHVIDYTLEDFADGARRYDVVLDIGGNASLSRLRRALAPRGTLVLVGGEGAGRWTGLGRQMCALMLSPFVRQRLRWFVSKHREADLRQLAAMIEAGDLTPIVSQTYPLARSGDAMRDLVAGRASGKLAITVAPAPDGALPGLAGSG